MEEIVRGSRIRSSLLGKISQRLQNQLCFPSYGCQLIRYKEFGLFNWDEIRFILDGSIGKFNID